VAGLARRDDPRLAAAARAAMGLSAAMVMPLAMALVPTRSTSGNDSARSP